MARYTGPKDKISRRFGIPLFGPSKVLERRPTPPGMHGGGRFRSKPSEYSEALAEKQKLRFQYGLLEKQFRRLFEEAARRRGITGEILLQLLETRLDNVLYRLGYGQTRSAARQFVGHGHVFVNGTRVNVPSFRCKPGDKITIRDNARSQQLGMRLLDQSQMRPLPEWVTMDKDKQTGTVSRIPTRAEIDPIVNEQLVVELYSR